MADAPVTKKAFVEKACEKLEELAEEYINARVDIDFITYVKNTNTINTVSLDCNAGVLIIYALKNDKRQLVECLISSPGHHLMSSYYKDYIKSVSSEYFPTFVAKFNECAKRHREQNPDEVHMDWYKAVLVYYTGDTQILDSTLVKLDHPKLFEYLFMSTDRFPRAVYFAYKYKSLFTSIKWNVQQYKGVLAALHGAKEYNVVHLFHMFSAKHVVHDLFTRFRIMGDHGNMIKFVRRVSPKCLGGCDSCRRRRDLPDWPAIIQEEVIDTIADAENVLSAPSVKITDICREEWSYFYDWVLRNMETRRWMLYGDALTGLFQCLTYVPDSIGVLFAKKFIAMAISRPNMLRELFINYIPQLSPMEYKNIILEFATFHHSLAMIISSIPPKKWDDVRELIAADNQMFGLTFMKKFTLKQSTLGTPFFWSCRLCNKDLHPLERHEHPYSGEIFVCDVNTRGSKRSHGQISQ